MEVYKIKCSNCGSDKTYTNKRSWYNAKANLKKKGRNLCKGCQSKEASEMLKGRDLPGRPVGSKTSKNTKFSRKCPGCGETQYYARKYNMQAAEKKKCLCNRCSNESKVKYLELITEEHIQKGIATRLGYETYQDYQDTLPEWKRYKNEVIRLTNKQPLHTLPNYDKPRGLCGVPGAYQLDHIISIREGFHKNIPPNEIADISNLQFITWEENRQKH